MPKLSVVIPSRDEKFLTPTIDDVLRNSRGDTEVVAVLDSNVWPGDWKEVTARHGNRLTTIHNGSSLGMRASINRGVASAVSRGADYLMKLDAHCLLDEGFDVKLLAEIEPNWIVVPRRKRLDPDAWVITEINKTDIDYHYLSFPDDPEDFGGPGLNGKVWETRAKERRDKPEYDLDSEMSSQGSAWCMASSYFQELELMDTDSYGPFWNEAQELFLKCWLSGGRGVINKRTFYAHLHKGSKHGRGYKLPESWLQQGASFTKKWIWNEAWDKQTLPFKWLIEHFWPVPTWPENWEEVLYAERKARLVPVAGDSALYSGGDPKRHMDGDGVVTVPPEAVAVSAKADDYAPAPADGLVIHNAYYGVDDDNRWAVAERLRELVKDNSLDVIVNNSTLTPDKNPFRGKKKKLWLTYSYDGGKPVTVERAEKEWLIIGQVQRDVNQEHVDHRLHRLHGGQMRYSGTDDQFVEAFRDFGNALLDLHATCIDITQKPKTAPALNDYLIRKFSISPQRLKAPMPIELNNFHRNDLAQLFAELGFKRGAEIGVAEGNYSEVLLRANPECELLLVDPWHAYSENPQNKTKEKHEFAYREVLRKTKDYPNVKIDMRYSMDAVRDVEDGSLDWVYLDAMHSFNFVMMDLICWSRKVRSAGVVALDDFYKIDPVRWGAGVVEAVQAYTSAHQINPWFICQGHKSVEAWWVRP